MEDNLFIFSFNIMNKSLRLFIFNVLIFVLIIGGVDFLGGEINRMFQFAVCEKFPRNIGSKTYYTINKSNEDIIIIGSSRASHHYVSRLITDSTKFSSYNCGQDGHFFVFSNCVINTLLERYSPKYIIWEVDDNCLTTTSPEQSINDLYPYYNLVYCKNVIDNMGIKQKIKMQSKLYRYNSTLDGLISPFLKVQNFDNGYVPIENLGYKYPTIKNDLIENEVNSDKVKMLKNTLINCIEHDVKIIITSSPKFTISNIKNTVQYKTLIQVCDDYDIPFIDLSGIDLFLRDSTYFKDNVHMNDKGARKYMEYFIPELKKAMNK